MRRPADRLLAPSVLDDLGEEITGIAWPVAACMAITVFLVRVLNPSGLSSRATVVIASAVYDEESNPDAPMLEKLWGAILNALVFVTIIVIMTFILVMLFKYGCYRCISVYMAFSVSNIFFLITGLLVVLLLQKMDLHVDLISLCFILYNFAAVGTAGTLFTPIPLLMKQGYMVWVGVVMAYIFTWVPDWTSWVLMLAMAVYDIGAVLMPGGPLKMLVELAIERQQPLPALIYESRPAGGYRGPGHWRDVQDDGSGRGRPVRGAGDSGIDLERQPLLAMGEQGQGQGRRRQQGPGQGQHHQGHHAVRHGGAHVLASGTTGVAMLPAPVPVLAVGISLAHEDDDSSSTAAGGHSRPGGGWSAVEGGAEPQQGEQQPSQQWFTAAVAGPIGAGPGPLGEGTELSEAWGSSETLSQADPLQQPQQPTTSATAGVAAATTSAAEHATSSVAVFAGDGRGSGKGDRSAPDGGLEPGPDVGALGQGPAPGPGFSGSGSGLGFSGAEAQELAGQPVPSSGDLLQAAEADPLAPQLLGQQQQQQQQQQRQQQGHGAHGQGMYAQQQQGQQPSGFPGQQQRQEQQQQQQQQQRGGTRQRRRRGAASGPGLEAEREPLLACSSSDALDQAHYTPQAAAAAPLATAGPAGIATACASATTAAAAAQTRAPGVGMAASGAEGGEAAICYTPPSLGVTPSHGPSAPANTTLIAAGAGAGAGPSVAASATRPPVSQQHPSRQPAAPPRASALEAEDDYIDMPDGVKLGLGDFIFYSMLVGKAAQRDMLSMCAAFIGILAGLGLTLMCLALYRHALPALPFSIALGVAFYFLAMALLEPYASQLFMRGTLY